VVHHLRDVDALGAQLLALLVQRRLGARLAKKMWRSRSSVERPMWEKPL
jgi:hypothetical protein